MKKLSLIFSIFLVVSVMLLLTATNTAWSNDRTLKKTQQPSALFKTNGSPVSTMININSVAGWIRNDGWSAGNPSTGNSGVFFPRGTATAIFRDGIVWGGNVDDGGTQTLRVGGQTFSIGTVGGRIISKGFAANPNDADVRIYRIRRDYKTADLRQDAAELLSKGLSAVSDGEIATIRAQYATDWNEWPTSQGAPYYDADNNGRYEPKFNVDGSPMLRPTAGETFDPVKHADEPGVADADQVIWFVCNDLDAGKTNALYGSNPIGIELQVTLWGYNRTDPLANVYFKKFTFIYKGTLTSQSGSKINDMYVGQWSDPDMGDAGDDFSGSDTTLSLGYVYNGSAVDGEYAKFGLKPPAVGYDFLQGPIVAGASTDSAVFGLKRVYGKKNLPMTAAFYFAAGGTYSDPPFSYEGTKQWYNLLRGLTPITGTPFVHPSFPNSPTKFWLDGDPVKGTGRLDGRVDNPGDRRLGVCSGPFTLALGDTQEIVVGVVAGIGADYLSSITVMKNNDVAVQSAYDNLFNLPKAPTQANLKITPLNKQLVLDWGSNLSAVKATEEFDRQGYTFEGYNVYQLPTASSSFDQAIKLATFDKEGNGIRTIADNVFDVSLGISIMVVKQKGTDSGIKRSLVITQDKVRNAPLVNGQSYYYAVTTYGYNPSSQALTHALESSLQIQTGIPKSADPGVRYYSSPGDSLKVTNTNPGIKSDGGVAPVIVDPTKATGKNYRVTFKNISTTFQYGPASNGLFYPVTADILNWYLTSGADTLYRSTNQGPTVPNNPGIHVSAAPPGLLTDFDVAAVFGNDYNYPIVDGFFIPVQGPPPQLNETRSRFTQGTSWLRGEGRFVSSTSALRSQATTAYDIDDLYLGAVGPGEPPSKFRDVEFRFGAGGSLTQKAYRYRRIGTYQFQNYVDVPFQVWDVSNPAAPRQLNCGWRDSRNNGQWDLFSPASGLLVEVIFVASSTYDGDNPTTFTYSNVVGNVTNTIPVKDYQMVAEWGSANGAYSDITASTILVSPNRVLTADDKFEFTAAAAPSYDAKVAKADVSAINVFPNPYYGFNRAETSRFQRFVTFNHLPKMVEVRIFNIAGALVKALKKDDANQFMNWDLSNINNLPVASGLYIAHLQLKDAAGADLGTKILKIVVIQEQQYLDNF